LCQPVRQPRHIPINRATIPINRATIPMCKQEGRWPLAQGLVVPLIHPLSQGSFTPKPANVHPHPAKHLRFCRIPPLLPLPLPSPGTQPVLGRGDAKVAPLAGGCYKPRARCGVWPRAPPGRSHTSAGVGDDAAFWFPQQPPLGRAIGDRKGFCWSQHGGHLPVVGMRCRHHDTCAWR